MRVEWNGSSGITRMCGPWQISWDRFSLTSRRRGCTWSQSHNTDLTPAMVMSGYHSQTNILPDYTCWSANHIQNTSSTFSADLVPSSCCSWPGQPGKCTRRTSRCAPHRGPLIHTVQVTDKCIVESPGRAGPSPPPTDNQNPAWRRALPT